MGKPLDRSGGLFGLSNKFESEFPTVDEAIIRFTESKFGHDKRKGIWNLRRDGPSMGCANPMCHRGGYDLANEVHNMLYSGVSEREIELDCRGDEGSPKGRNKGKACLHRLKATVTIQFKEGRHQEKAIKDKVNQ